MMESLFQPYTEAAPKRYLREASRRAKKPPASALLVVTGGKRIAASLRTDQVVGHEGELQLVVVLVVDAPQGVLVSLVVLPEPGHGDGASVLVGVLALPVIEDQGGLAQGLERVLGLGSRLGLLLFLLSGGSSRGGLLLGLLLLLRGDVLDSLLSEDGILDNSLEDGLVDDGGVPSGGGRVLGAPLLVQEKGESASEETSSEDIGQGQALTDEVGVSGEVSLQHGDVLQGGLGGILDNLLVVGVLADQRAVPATETGEELRVGIRHPAEDGSVVLLGLAQKGGLLILGGDLASVSSCEKLEVGWHEKKRGSFRLEAG